MHLDRNALFIPTLIALTAGLCVAIADAGIVPVTRGSTGEAHAQDGEPVFSSDTQSRELPGRVSRNGRARLTATVGIQEAPSICAPSLEFTSSRGVGANPASIASGDFNRDGTLDIAVENNNSNDVSVLLGNGDGTFGALTSFATGGGPRSVTVADLNEDGKPDLIVANYAADSIVALLGIGDGTFMPAQQIASGPNPHSVAVGDLNGDGHLDIAAACLGNANTIRVALGFGDGTFGPASDVTASANSINISLADLNGDGRLDVVAVSPSPASVLMTLRGNGDGTFQSAIDYPVGAEPLYQRTADFNGDGLPDVAVTQAHSNRTSVFLGTGTGALAWSSDYATPGVPIKVSSADLNLDGNTDLVVNSVDGVVALLLGDGLGAFAAPLFMPVPSNGDFTIGDFNGDAQPDLIASASNAGSISIVLNRGTPSTAVTAQPDSAAVLPGLSATFDINADGLNLVYLWKKNGVALAEGGTVSGSTTSNLQIANVQSADQGSYTCTVWGSCGEDISEPATLDCRPIITSQAPAHAPLKRTLQLSVGVPDAAPYTYRWKRYGVELANTPGIYSGASTKTLRILSPDFYLGGTFSCELTDVCGTTKSADSRVCLADFNSDEMIDDADFVAFAGAYDTLTCEDGAVGCPADFNNDTVVDDSDFVAFVLAYTELLCP